MTRSVIGGGAATLALLAIAGCSTVNPSASHVQVAATAPLDFWPPLCRVTGPSEVLAKRAFVPRGVEAIERGAGFEVRFGRDRAECLAVEWSSPGDVPVESPCPGKDGRAIAGGVREDEAMLACESSAVGADRWKPGVVADDAPPAVADVSPGDRETLVAPPFYAFRRGGEGHAAAPVLLPVGDAGSLSLWVEGGTEAHDLHARSVSGHGDPWGPTLDLSSRDVSVIGRASAALRANGEGLVVYLASTGSEFDVFGTPIACAMPDENAPPP